jgi:hypothetical protein
MNKHLKTFAWLACCSITAGAAVPPPEKLLPAETLGVITVPDWAKAKAVYDANPGNQLWRDPALKPFRDKLVNKIKDEFIKPLERELGVNLNDYSSLAQGQLTFAVLQNGWQGKANPSPAWLLLIDAREQSSQLKTNLADLRKKWIDAGKKLKTDKIRDVEFTTLTVSGEDVAKTLEKSLADSKTEKDDDPKEKSPDKKASTTVTIGQSESLLIVGSDPKAIEKILVRQSGGAVPPLGEQAAFDGDYQGRFRNALAYGWVHFKPIGEVLNRLASEAGAKDNSPDSLDWSKIVTASGVAGLKTISFSLNGTPEGSFGEFHFGVPASSRVGLFKIIAAEAKDANPPPFVPADAVKFQRFRLDVQKAWNTLESMVSEISPQMGGGLKLILETAGKDKDPNFDLRKELIGNLGDDLISFQKNPRSNTLADLNSPPALYLLGSPNAEKLAAALKTIASLLPPQLTNIKERELLGRKVYSLTLPGAPNPDGSMTQRNLSYSASGGYLALSTDDALLETYLRSGENTGKTLRDTVGLAEAAQKIGGMSTGMFGYENTSETVRVLLETLKNDYGTVEKLLLMMPFVPKPGGKDSKGLKDWVDFSLLPPFDQIAKYFYFTVYSGSANADGLSYKVFSPTPPQLKK